MTSSYDVYLSHYITNGSVACWLRPGGSEILREVRGKQMLERVQQWIEGNMEREVSVWRED